MKKSISWQINFNQLNKQIFYRLNVLVERESTKYPMYNYYAFGYHII